MPPETPSSEQLTLLINLLAAPQEDSLEILQELISEYPWLQNPVQQLGDLPLDHWQAEHTQLFVSGYPKTMCPPFESVYRRRIMNSSICGDILQFYHSIDLEPTNELPPDYLGTLLECALFLREQTPFNAEAWHALWAQHLNPWVPQFAKDLQQHSQLQLYQQLGQQLVTLFP